MIANKNISKKKIQALSKIGDTDISAIGDGTLTGAVSTNANSITELNNDLLYKSCGNKNLNEVIKAGIYYCTSSSGASLENNFPVAHKGYLVVLNPSSTSTMVQQIYYVSKGVTYIRTHWDNSWSAWEGYATQKQITNITNLLKSESNVARTYITFVSNTPETFINQSYSFYVVRNGICYFQLSFTLTNNTENFDACSLPASAMGNYMYFDKDCQESTGNRAMCRVNSNGTVRINGKAGTYTIQGSYPIA